MCRDPHTHTHADLVTLWQAEAGAVSPSKSLSGFQGQVVGVLSSLKPYRLEMFGIAAYASVAFELFGSDTLVPLSVETPASSGGMGLGKSFTGHYLLV